MSTTNRIPHILCHPAPRKRRMLRPCFNQSGLDVGYVATPVTATCPGYCWLVGKRIPQPQSDPSALFPTSSQQVYRWFCGFSQYAREACHVFVLALGLFPLGLSYARLPRTFTCGRRGPGRTCLKRGTGTYSLHAEKRQATVKECFWTKSSPSAVIHDSFELQLLLTGLGIVFGYRPQILLSYAR